MADCLGQQLYVIGMGPISQSFPLIQGFHILFNAASKFMGHMGNNNYYIALSRIMPAVNFNMVSSGSRGNCSLVWDDETLLVFDFGITMKRFRERLELLGINHREYSLFISHEHSDHSKGIGMVKKYHSFDLYSREATLDALRFRDGYSIKDSVAIGNFHVKAISVSHDAADPVGYVVQSGNSRISIVSDLGKVSDELIRETRDSDILAFEANHDVEMLKYGRYPEMLKRRILSNHGHLSNEQSAEAISSIAGTGTRIVLTHLSQENNTPDTAYSAIRDHLENRSVQYASLECATQDKGSSHMVVQKD